MSRHPVGRIVSARPKPRAAEAAQRRSQGIRILIAEEDTLVRDGLRRILATGLPGIRFSNAKTGSDALRLARTRKFDGVDLDLSSRGRAGLDVLRRFQKTHPALPVLILSRHTEEQLAIRALREGASGYLTQRRAAEHIVRAVRRIASGHKYITESLAERLASDLQLSVSPFERLSNREREVLRLLARGKTLTAIARALSLALQTVSTYRMRISEKTGLHSREDLARYAAANPVFG